MNLSKIDGCLLGPEIRPHDCYFQKKTSILVLQIRPHDCCLQFCWCASYYHLNMLIEFFFLPYSVI
jgi:hypothetical protein